MKEIIVIAGAPGSGKSTVAHALHRRLDSPMFEFGWIPEFRNTGRRELTYVEEESLAFENLILVVKNYVKHGFENVIITDLKNDYVGQLPRILATYSFLIVTLRLSDEDVLKTRVLNEGRTSEYRDWKAAIAINKGLRERAAFQHEVFLDAGVQSVDQIVEQIVETLRR